METVEQARLARMTSKDDLVDVDGNSIPNLVCALCKRKFNRGYAYRYEIVLRKMNAVSGSHVSREVLAGVICPDCVENRTLKILKANSEVFE